ncbi:MAG: small-conductance mechanosensitive channel [Oscillospiraceae bacterium]|nr:small-conductance mechanosensitive channel [Oscillospiraceae bacterium]
MDFSAFSDFLSIDFGSLTVGEVLRAVILAVVCLIVTFILLRVTDHAFRKIEFQQSLHGFIRAIVKSLLLLISVMVVASSLGIEVTSLLAVLSVAGLAVSLAIQNMLSNVAGGLQILSAKPYHVGEFIEAGGISGTVTEIGVIYTKVRTVDNKLIYIPNSDIADTKVINYSSQENRRVDLELSVSYDAPITQVKQALQSVVAQHPKVLPSPEPMVRVNAYQDSAVQYVVQVWCANADYLSVKYDLLEQIKPALDAADIEMTYNHLNVHLIGTQADAE